MPVSFNPDTSPPSFKNHLIRKTLLRKISADARKLNLIQAPAGYGKTSFLKQVYDHLSTPHVWMNIRQTDNDPINFLHKWHHALSHLDTSGKPSSSLTYTSGFTAPSIELWTRSLIDEINKHSGFAIFLNDVDFIQSEGAISIINLLLQMSHNGIQIFMTASSNLRFSYSQLLVENQVCTVTQDALRFSHEDMQAIFKLHHKKVPEENLSHQLAELTEGWPAAAFYMASSLQDESDLQRFIEDSHLKQQAFDRYFVERVFEQQGKDVQQLLLKLSLLDRFDLSICKSLSQSQAQYQAFWPYVEQHTFITPIESSGKWYRFHQLFALFLRHRCQLEFNEAERNSWQTDAAQCFFDDGEIEEAIPLAIQAKNFERAAEWMENAFPTIVVRMGKHLTYHHWYDALPDSIHQQHPRVRIGSIWARLANRHFLNVAEQVQWLIQHKTEYAEHIQQEIMRISELAMCCMEGLKDNPIKAAPLADSWLSKWSDPALFKQADDHHYETGLALLIKGFCAKCLSQHQAAREALNLAAQHLHAFGSFYGITIAKALLAVTYAKQGFHHEAQREAIEGYQLAKQNLGEKSHNGYGLAALLAAIHYEHDELEAARPYLKGILPFLKEQSPSDLLIAAFETQARLLINEQAFEEAFGLLKDGIKWAETQALPRLKFKLLDELIVNLIRQQRFPEAERYASEYDLILRSADDFAIDTSKHNITARAIIFSLWQRKAMPESQKILARLLARAKSKGQLRRQAEWVKLLVIDFALDKQTETSQAYLLELLTLAQPQNYIRLILDEPALVPALLQLENTAHARKKLDKESDRFFTTLLQKIHPTQTVDGQPYIEALTAKEVEIIQLLAEGLPNKTIAETLLVSIGTLKWHLHNIYSKLLVKNRTQALLEAKKQGYV
ncbi:MAG: LuxR C-terminal-related transcriptional regulator [Oleiphilus sp.]